MESKSLRMFVPAEGVDDTVLAAYLQGFVDPAATVALTSHPQLRDRDGFLVTSNRVLDKGDLLAIVRDSKQWTTEQKSSARHSRRDYKSSETWKQRLQEGPGSREPKPATFGSSIRTSREAPTATDSTESSQRRPITQTRLQTNNRTPSTIDVNSQLRDGSRSREPDPYDFRSLRALRVADTAYRDSLHQNLQDGPELQASVHTNAQAPTTAVSNSRYPEHRSNPQTSAQVDSRTPTYTYYSQHGPNPHTSVQADYRVTTSGPSQPQGHDRHDPNASGRRTVSISQAVERHDFAPDNFTSRHTSSYDRVGSSDRHAPTYRVSSDRPATNDNVRLPKQLSSLSLRDHLQDNRPSDARSFDSNSTDSTIGSVFQVALGDDLIVNCIVDSGSSSNFISEELLKKILRRMPEKRRDVKPYWSMREYFSVLKSDKTIKIVGQISLHLDWHCRRDPSKARKAIRFKIVEKGQLHHDMIVKWKTAKRQGISLDDYHRGADLERPFVATVPSAKLPKRSKEQRSQDQTNRNQNRDRWAEAELARENNTGNGQGATNQSQRPQTGRSGQNPHRA